MKVKINRKIINTYDIEDLCSTALKKFLVCTNTYLYNVQATCKNKDQESRYL
jgi:hypothetical protein